MHPTVFVQKPGCVFFLHILFLDCAKFYSKHIWESILILDGYRGGARNKNRVWIYGH